MSATTGKFATVLGCMDGRSVSAISKFLDERYDVQYPDMITAPGVDKICAAMPENEKAEYQNRVVAISLNHHGSRMLVVSGHQDCAGNVATPEEHKEHMKKGLDEVATWNLPAGTTLLGLWVAPNEKGEWVAEETEKRTI
jgi:carbonic anhydrase